MSEQLYEQLLVHRVEILEQHPNEESIIRELKYYLLELKYQSPELNYTYETIDNILVEFYKYFDIDVSEETIRGIEVNTNAYTGNPSNSIMNMFNSILNELEVKEDDLHEDEDEMPNHPHVSFDNTMFYNTHSSIILNNNAPFNPLPLFNYNLNSSMSQLFTSLINYHSHNINGPSQQPPPITILNNSQPNFVNLFNNNEPPQFVNILNQLINPQQFQDVVVTVDENEFDKLNTRVLDSKMEYDCAICLDTMEKDAKVTELNCKHTYHTSCIEPYLKQYNYKCPVCRADVGKHKYNY
jgi:hypothetical protein